MGVLLDAIRTEREQLLAPVQGRLTQLDELERLATAYHGENGVGGGPTVPDAAPPKNEAPVKPAAGRGAATTRPRRPSGQTARGRDGLGPRVQAVLEAIRANSGWMTIREIWDACPGAPVNSPVQQLARAGLIEAQGATSRRRYRAIVAAPAPAPETADPPPDPTSPAPPSEPLGVAASRVLRSRILDHLERRGLDEKSLAGHLRADREHVAFICGQLLVDGLITLMPDGRYTNP